MGGRQSKASHEEPFQYHDSRYQGSGSSYPEYSPSTPTNIDAKKRLTREFSRIIDNYNTVEQVTSALRDSGLESSNLIVGIDFTKSNEWTGKNSFNGRNLHAIGNTPNPYEQAISIIGRTLSPFDDDNLIPCFGFGDVTTHDREVFSFYPDHRPCDGFEDALTRYREIVPFIKLAGPTSFAPVIEAAVDIVVQSGCQYHVLVIIADGQVTRSVDTDSGMLSPQEQSTIDAIVEASEYPLSIVLVGVGDGPWDMMQKFDDNIPERRFDNFQFVNFTSIMSRNRSFQQREASFALAALMEIPIQYKAALALRLFNRTTNRKPKLKPLPSPGPLVARSPVMPQMGVNRQYSNSDSFSTFKQNVESSQTEDNQLCPICWVNPKNMAFNCGHQTCEDCGTNLRACPICRKDIELRLKLY